MNRRRFLRIAAPASVVGLTGCNSYSDEASPSSRTSFSTATSATQTDEWTAAAAVSIQEAEIENDTITVGDRIQVHVEVTNTGDEAGEERLRLETTAGSELASQPVSVPAGETVSTTLTTNAAPEAGDVPLLLNGERIGTVTVEEPASIFHVGPDGSDSNPGTEDEPLETILEALKAVDPGGIVNVLPGEYHQFIGINEDTSGEPGKPVTVTGPPEAVIKPMREDLPLVYVSHSHFRLTGLTLSGLLDEANPSDPDSHLDTSIVGISPDEPDPYDPHYVEDLVLSPRRIGYARGAFINAALLKDSEIGGFKVIGPAGSAWTLGDIEGHSGEFVYLGTANNNLKKHEGLEVYDETRNIHVHHIDNSAGYPHSEIVDCKIGTHNITIEYCTDGGGAQTAQSYYQPAINLDGRGHTVRWNVIQNAFGDGVRIGPQSFLSDKPDFEFLVEPKTEFERSMGKDHAIYGNVFTGNKHEAVNFLRESRRPGRESNPLPEDQRVLCGNLYDGYADFEPEAACPADVPAGDGVGHLGGDSPWEGSAPTKEDVFERDAQGLNLDVAVHEESAPTNTAFEVPITVANTGDSPEEVVLRLRAAEYSLDSETVSVQPDGEKRVTLTERDLPVGNYSVMRNGQKLAPFRITDG